MILVIQTLDEGFVVTVVAGEGDDVTLPFAQLSGVTVKKFAIEKKADLGRVLAAELRDDPAPA